MPVNCVDNFSASCVVNEIINQPHDVIDSLSTCLIIV